jgi:hypothetical protein
MPLRAAAEFNNFDGIDELSASADCPPTESGCPRSYILYSPWALFVRPSYAPIGVVSLGVELVSSVSPLVRTALVSRHSAFPLPRPLFVSMS